MLDSRVQLYWLSNYRSNLIYLLRFLGTQRVEWAEPPFWKTMWVDVSDPTLNKSVFKTEKFKVVQNFRKFYFHFLRSFIFDLLSNSFKLSQNTPLLNQEESVHATFSIGLLDQYNFLLWTQHNRNIGQSGLILWVFKDQDQGFKDTPEILCNLIFRCPTGHL